MKNLLILLLALMCAASTPAHAQGVFKDDFAAYGPHAAIEDNWTILGGTMRIDGGRLRSVSRGQVTAFPNAVSETGAQTIEVSATPIKRLSTGGWAAIGLAVYGDGSNFWRLSLVDPPSGPTYCELVEMREGVWQAQDRPGTRLAPLPDSTGAPWRYGRTYRLHIALSHDRIVGEVFEGSATGPLIFRIEYALPQSTPAVRSGVLALMTVDMDGAFQDPTGPLGEAASPSGSAHRPYTLAVHAAAPDAEKVRQALVGAGFAADLLTDEDIASSDRLNTAAFDAIVFPDGALCPIAAKENLLRFLRQRGGMVVVGGPIFERSVQAAQEDYNRRLAAVPTAHATIDLERIPTSGWRRASSAMASPTTWEVEQSGPPEAPAALHIVIPNLNGWDTLSTSIAGAYAPGEDATVFWVRGGPRTTAMTVEIQEKDGSRWIAAAPVTPQWRRVVLTPDAFGYWPDNPSKGRGAAGDRLHPENAATISVGIAQSHAHAPNGRHELWLAGFGCATLPEDLRRIDLSLPTLELFSPFYKYYRLPSLRPTTAELRAAADTGNQSGRIVTPIPRPRGLGFASVRPGRWIPLETIRDETGRVCGTRASLWINCGASYRGSVWGQAASGDIVPLVQRMAEGVFLTRAGAEQFSYFVGEQAPLAFEVFNTRPVPRTIQARLEVRRGRAVLRRELVRLDLAAYGRRTVRIARSWIAPSAGDYAVVTTLLDGRKELDSITQPVSVLATDSRAPALFVRVKQGSFLAPPVGGAAGPVRKWYPYGCNYWQSNVAGADVQQYSLHWLAPGYYDPSIVERDLATLQSLGFTSVSIQLNDPQHVRQANDFIRRAACHGIRTNLFIAGAHPFYTDEALFTRLIREGRFAHNPNVWAFDIAWEHHLGHHDERTSWDREWEAWIVERYGSVEHAEQVWGYPAPRDAAGRVTNPSDEQLRRDGPWLKMANAYCRCADDVIARRYARVIRKIRALDPNHLVSARSASQPSWTGWFAYDMVSCGKAFDFSSPEGYGVNPAEGGFSVAYARWAGNGKPVFWAEFGSSIYPYDSTGQKEREQAALCRGFAKMLLDSGANGLANWWSVGGYRVDEKSDFGIIAPDGTPRASALALAAGARAATSPRSTRPPGVWVTVDRDLHAAAFEAMYQEHKQAYVDAVKAGTMLGVRTAGTGTTSANVPLTCVGNVPYDGFEPLKYMNAEFYRVEVLDAAGAWREAADGAVVDVAAGRPVRARVTAGNLGEAKWLASGPVGAVRLIGDDRPDARSTDRPRLAFAARLPHDVARYQDVELRDVVLTPGIRRESEVVLTFEAAGRARFGERRLIVLRPR